ncbi:MAG TPA: heavy metal transporter [Ruminococcus sp.]|nr:heavy metal transporter [Ruminococcus sp.]
MIYPEVRSMADRKACHLKISGMYCIQCEQRIKKALQSIQGVHNVNVSYKSARVEFETEGNVNYERIVKAVEAEGYTVAGTADSRFPVKGFLSLAAITILYIALQYTGLLNKLAPSQLAQSGMGYGMLLLIGAVTSVHCIAMCGGISLSQSIPDERKSSFVRPLLYNLGRVASYTAIGAGLGTVGYFIGGGSAVSVPLTIQGLIKIIAGVVLLIMGLRLIGAFSWLQRLSLPLPKRLVRTIGKMSAKTGSSFVVGLLNGLMPCGPLQAMWLIALASGSPIKGALSMLLFSIGTLPLMLGLSSLVAALGKKFAHTVQNAGAVVVAVMGLALLTQGGVLSGVLPAALASSGSAKDTAVNIGGVQIVKSELTSGKYPEITVRTGVPVRWNIYAEKSSINGCNGKLICNSLDLEYEFHEGNNIIEFTPEGTGDISYSCWMGMIYGKIHITE